MLLSVDIKNLYDNVIKNDILSYDLPSDSIRNGIKNMGEVYGSISKRIREERSTVADFNDPAHRCAYLHKFAPLHTAMVRDMMFSAIRRNYNFFEELIFTQDCFKICSLGGGPGSDLIGVLASLHCTFNFVQTSVTMIDYMINWSYSFSSIIQELCSGSYGKLGDIVNQSLQWRYIGANLLKSLTPEVEREISEASFVTMIKFVSATSCKTTELMIENIFTAMKPGAALFFIDNQAGGYLKMVTNAARKYNFIQIFGPLENELYINEIVKNKKFGYTSCHRSLISVCILQKPLGIQPELHITVPNKYYDSNLEYSRRVLVESPVNDASNGLRDNKLFHRVDSFSSYQSNCAEKGFSNNNHFFSPLMPSAPQTTDVYHNLNGTAMPVERIQNAPPYVYSSDWNGTVNPLDRFQSSLITPYEYHCNLDNALTNVLGRSPSVPVTPYVYHSNFIDTMSSENRQPIFNPDTTPASSNKRRIHGRSGCLPFPSFKQWRHHLSRKFDTVKFQMSTIRKKRKKKSKSKNVSRK